MKVSAKIILSKIVRKIARKLMFKMVPKLVFEIVPKLVAKRRRHQPFADRRQRFLTPGPGGTDASTEHFGETIASGSTEDFLLTWKPNPTDPNSPAQPFPAGVTVPSYRNLLFKDNNTWYSGSPYLGYKGTLPTGTTSQNVCGEFYYPWHSHALNEFTNFEAGFGGMEERAPFEVSA